MDVYGYKKQTYKSGLAHQDNINSTYLNTTQSLYPIIDNNNNNNNNKKYNNDIKNNSNKMNYKLGSYIQQNHSPHYKNNHTHGQESLPPPILKQQQQQKYTQDSLYYSKVIEPTTTPTIHNHHNNHSISSINTNHQQQQQQQQRSVTFSSSNKKGFQSWLNYKQSNISSSSSSSLSSSSSMNNYSPITNNTTTSSSSSLFLISITTQLVQTYKKRNSKFNYQQHKNPKRILTKPSKPAKNDGYDNENHDYILFVNDILGEEHGSRYKVIDLLGQGTFGQVVKCEHITTGKLYSVKVIKNRPAFRSQSCMEVEILKQLNQKMDAKNQHHILRLEHTFNHKNHLCLVFELLSFNLYELIKQNGYKGLSIHLVRNITKQLLETLDFLNEINIIHCDLKPENILLESVNSPKIKVIDFGSACHKASPVFTYIQSRFYRSPEILLQMRYTNAIDMWSLGCIVAELFLGMPLFPGSTEFDQINRIMHMLGQPSDDMLHRGEKTKLFFDQESTSGNIVYKRKPLEKYNREYKKAELPSKRYFPYDKLDDLIMKSNNGWKNIPESKIDKRAIQYDIQMRQWLLEFLYKTLDLNPLTRWSPYDALHHPFITGKDHSKKSNTQLYNEPLKRFSKSMHQEDQQQYINHDNNNNNNNKSINMNHNNHNNHNHNNHNRNNDDEINNSISKTMNHSSSTSYINHYDNQNNNNNNKQKSRHRTQSLHFTTVPQNLKQLAAEIQLSTKEGLLPQPQQQHQQLLLDQQQTIQKRRSLRNKHTRSMYNDIGILANSKMTNMNHHDQKSNESSLYPNLPPTTIV
ncbi:unnamed protein product [Cunninghamella blakesleeana]